MMHNYNHENGTKISLFCMDSLIGYFFITIIDIPLIIRTKLISVQVKESGELGSLADAVLAKSVYGLYCQL